MVKAVAQKREQRRQQKRGGDEADGGAIDLGTVATPLVLYGLHTLLKDDGKEAMAKVTKPFKRLGRRGFAKRGGAEGDMVAAEMDAPVSAAPPAVGGEEMQEDFANFQLGGKKPWGMKKMKKGGDKDEEEEELEGGKKKQQRKQKGGEEELEGGKKKQQRKQKGGEEDKEDKDEELEGGKKKQQRKQRKQKGGEEDKEEELEGGKKKQQRKQRKQKGGDTFAALEDYYKMPLDQPAPVPLGNGVATQDSGVTATPPAAPQIPPATPQDGGKKQQRKRSAKKGGNALENLIKDMGLGQVNYDKFGNLAAAGDVEQKGGALEQYTQQLNELSQKLDSMIRGAQQDGGKKKKSAKKH